MSAATPTPRLESTWPMNVNLLMENLHFSKLRVRPRSRRRFITFRSRSSCCYWVAPCTMMSSDMLCTPSISCNVYWMILFWGSLYPKYKSLIITFFKFFHTVTSYGVGVSLTGYTASYSVFNGCVDARKPDVAPNERFGLDGPHEPAGTLCPVARQVLQFECTWAARFLDDLQQALLK